MKKYLLLLSVALLFVFGSISFADTKDVKADTKIAVIDLNKVLMGCPQLESAKKKLKSEFDPRGKEIEKAQKKFQSDIQDFSKNSPTMKADDKKSAEQKLKNDQQKLQEMQTKFQNDLESAQSAEMQKITKKIEEVVAKIAADKKFDLILAKTSAPYNKPELDITNDALKQIKK